MRKTATGSWRPAVGKLMAIVFLCVASSAYADFLGDTIRPFASVTEMYDSNVFRVRDQNQLRDMNGDTQMGDFLTVVSVGTDVHYLLNRQELNLMLKKDFIRYSHYTSQNVSTDEVKANVGLILFDRLKIRLLGSYNMNPVPRQDYQGTALNKRTDVLGGITAGYDMQSGVGLEAGYRKEKVSYSLEDFNANEYSRTSYSGTLKYRLSTDTKIYATIQREYTKYKEELIVGFFDLIDNDSVSDSIRFGIEKTISPKTAVSAYIGYLERRHKQASERDFDGIIGKVEATYGLTAKLGLLVNAERQIYEEIDPNRTYSVTDSIGAGLIYDITEKTRARLFDKYSWKNYRNVPDADVPKRTDRLHEMSAGVQWKPMKAVTVDVGYQYSTRKSDLSSLNFTDHNVIAGVAYHF